MSTLSASHEGRTGLVQVRLSQIPEDVRSAVAAELTKSWGLSGTPALLMSLWAVAPRHDPILSVPAEKAAALLERGARPAGPTPRFPPPQEFLDAETFAEGRAA